MRRVRDLSIFLFCVLMITGLGASAQRTIRRGAEEMELIKMAHLYNHTPDLGYRVSYSYTDSLTPAAILDSDYLDCELAAGKSFVSNDEMELLNDGQHMLYLDKVDSTITVSAARPRPIMQLPLLDSIFRVVNVSSMTVTNVSDSVRKLTIHFTPWSIYRGYTIVYNPTNYLIAQIQYYTASRGEYNLPAGHVLCTTITLTGYDNSPVDPSLVNINRYVYLLNGQYFLQPAYQQYQITNHP